MKRVKKSKRNAAMRKMIVFVQLITLAGLAGMIFMKDALPLKYLAVVAAGLFGMWLICFGLQLTKKKIHFLGLLLSVALSAVQFAGIIYVDQGKEIPLKVQDAGSQTTDSADEADNANEADETGEAEGADAAGETEKKNKVEYDANKLIVVVQDEDPAQTIADTNGYWYGVHKTDDSKATEDLLEEIQSSVEKKLKVEQYEDIVEVAWAIMDGEVQAVVYNESQWAAIEEEIEEFDSRVRILYEYKIDAE